MNRRKFFGLAAALPFIGMAFPNVAKAYSVGTPKIVDPIEKYNFRRIIVLIKQELRYIVKCQQFELCDEITRKKLNYACSDMLERFRTRGVIGDWMVTTEICPITHTSMIGQLFFSPKGVSRGDGPYVVIDFKLTTNGFYGIIEA